MWEINPFDPLMRVDYTGTNYKIEEVVFDPSDESNTFNFCFKQV